MESTTVLLAVCLLFFVAWAITFIVFLRQNFQKDEQIRQLTEILLPGRYLQRQEVAAKQPEKPQPSRTYEHMKKMVEKFNLNGTGPKLPETEEAQRGKPAEKDDRVKSVGINYGTS